MALSRIYVSGSYLMWESGSAQYRAQGALPSPSVFGGQTSGRIWVASATTDTFLYYSDSTGTTRFLQGIYRGPTPANTAAGRVYANQGICPQNPNAWQELYWTTSGSSGMEYRSFRGESLLPSQESVIDIVWSWNGESGSPNSGSNALFAYLNTGPFKQDITISGIQISLYSTTDCSGPAIAPNPRTIPSLTIPAGSGSNGVFTNYSGSSNGSVLVQSVRLDTGSVPMTIDGIQRRDGDFNYCSGVDIFTDTLITPRGCFATPASPTILQCGNTCDPNANYCDPNGGCPVCQETYAGSGAYTCQAQGSGPAAPDCGAFCDALGANVGANVVDGCYSNTSGCTECRKGDTLEGLYDPDLYYCAP